MIVRVPIPALCNVLEAVVGELAQEARVPVVAKVLHQAPALLEANWGQDFERSTVIAPSDVPNVGRIRQNIVDLLRERHVFYSRRVLVTNLRWDFGEVSIGVIHVGSGLLHNLIKEREDERILSVVGNR